MDIILHSEPEAFGTGTLNRQSDGVCPLEVGNIGNFFLAWFKSG
jgi:hypothetical protein